MNFNGSIYIVEDDEGIRELYEGAFEGAYSIELFGDGTSFLARFVEERPSLVLLDIMLPDMDGFTILSRIRERDEKIPVIIVSAKSDEISFVKGLNKGADDYMAKPFSVLELMARVRTNLRRTELYVKSCNEFKVDTNLYAVFFRDKKLELTLKEFQLLKTLIGHVDVTVGREDLFREVWGDEYFGETRTLDMHIASVREKIKQAGGGDCIVTVRGVGYRFTSKTEQS